MEIQGQGKVDMMWNSQGIHYEEEISRLNYKIYSRWKWGIQHNEKYRHHDKSCMYIEKLGN